MNAGIEASRFVLASSVAVFHWNGSLPNAYLAVDLFFIISGWVIARRYEAALRAGASSLDFAVGRVIRLYPLYLLSVAFGLGSALIEPMVTPAWSYSLAGLWWRAMLLVPVLDVAAQPVGIQSFPLNNPAWSLWCEVLASGLFCALCRLPGWAMAMPAMLGGVVLVATAFSGQTFSAGGDGPTVVIGLGRIGFSFFAGVLLQRLSSSAVLTGWRAVLGIAALLGMVLVYFRVTETRAETVWPVLMVLIGVFPLLTLCVARCELGGRVARWCIVGGSASYAVYILHWPLFRMARWLTRSMGISEADRSDFGITLGVVVGLIGVSLVATAYFDAPVRRSLNAWRRGRMAVNVA